jgi:uncharacterized protein with HEPN domain
VPSRNWPLRIQDIVDSINIPPEIQSRYPLIPWRLMGGMRNVVTHEYFQVDLSRVWETINNDLPSLVPQLREILDRGISEE